MDYTPGLARKSYNPGGCKQRASNCLAVLKSRVRNGGSAPLQAGRKGALPPTAPACSLAPSCPFPESVSTVLTQPDGLQLSPRHTLSLSLLVDFETGHCYEAQTGFISLLQLTEAMVPDAPPFQMCTAGPASHKGTSPSSDSEPIVPVTEYSDRSNLEKKGFVCLSVPGHSPSLWGGRGRNLEQLAVICSQEQRAMN